MAEQLNLPDENAKRLEALLGFDPVKVKMGEGVFADALKEVNEERDKIKKEQIKEKLWKLIEVRLQMEKIKRDFLSAWNKHHKELGKAVNTLQNEVKGLPPAPEGDDKDRDGEQGGTNEA